MSLTGDLTDLPFHELIHVLQHHTGTLAFDYALQGRHAELVLQTGRLKALFIDGFSVTDLAAVRHTLQYLATLSTGPWEFTTTPLSEVRQEVDYELADLLFNNRSDAIPDDHLPHPITAFTQSSGLLSVPADLRPTWAALQPHLSQGSSAEQIAYQRHISVREAQELLYRLRAVGLIEPKRAAPQFNFTSTPLPTVAAQRPAAPTPVQRFLGALRRFAGARA